jgi:hypothetical protein
MSACPYWLGWRVSVDGFEQQSLVAAPTRGCARFAVLAILADIGYRPRLGSVRVRRAPVADRWARYQGEHRERPWDTRRAVDWSVVDDLL